ncbi:MAG: hypothetical protein JST22_13325 [Bacteroidetes bacterium]|nr:hypothetical protein [Bacteroidota bacterium]
MSVPQVVELGEEGLRFIERNLENGLSLSQLVRRRYQLQSGLVWAPLPPDVDKSSIENRSAKEFRWGGLTEVGGSLEILTSFVSRYLESLSGGICIFEYANAKSTDPVIQRETSGILTFGLEVYCVVQSCRADPDTIAAAIRGSDSLWTHVGFLSASLAGLPDENRAALALEDLESIADGVEHIIVGAFDGEGYLIWSRNG